MKSLIATFFQTIQFWKNPKKPKQGRDYKIIDIGDDLSGICILRKKYNGICYHYTNVNVEEKPEIGVCVLKFGYVIIEPEDYGSADAELELLMGDILQDIISKE